MAANGMTFSPEEIPPWPTLSFEDETEYRVVARDGAQRLQTNAQKQASAKYLVSDYNQERARAVNGNITPAAAEQAPKRVSQGTSSLNT
ncbi:MAG: hypothetical protein L0J54_09980 [Halomonas sp.]|nr:hypothetical protein [Halomonas sp.]MDN6298333.1 hypothetical protein [Halomonas sp.]MDN6315715.1 hypothetical protein [Halomonas sp.]MDN6337160.1 hypothetical protein [Halomonas sp.]